MSGLAKTAGIHLGIGPRHLWNVWPKTTHQSHQGLNELKNYYSQIRFGNIVINIYGRQICLAN
jgi:hypothetical protein